MKFMNLFVLLALTSFVLVGCSSDTAKAPIEKKGGSVDEDVTEVGLEGTCAQCGCCAGCEECCSDDLERCEKCNFKKGSMLCCIGVEPTDGVYCECGNLEGSEECCKEDSEDCEKCGLQKGSALCCKLKPADDAKADDAKADDSKADAKADDAKADDAEADDKEDKE